MNDPWKGAWEHLKKNIATLKRTCKEWAESYPTMKGRVVPMITAYEDIQDWMKAKEREMVEDGLIDKEGAEE